MYFNQSDLLSGLTRDFLRKFRNIANKVTHRKGTYLFHEGDPANFFFILKKGNVIIKIGENAHSVYTVDRSGEAFGWSSLVGRDVYSASAECDESTLLLKIKGSKLKEILEEDPATGLLFYKHLTTILGERLLETYKLIPLSLQPGVESSYGTGQMVESEMRIL